MSSEPLRPSDAAWRRPRWNLDARCKQFPILAAMRERVLVFDSAMGTMIHSADLSLDDYQGKENCCEVINESRPDVIGAIHAAYFDAGADIVETNTFGGAGVVLREFGLEDRTYELSRQAAKIAREVASGYAATGRPRFVAGSVGPTTKMVSLGHIGFDEQRAS